MIKWDEQKNEWLIRERGISFEELAEIILAGGYLDILENEARPAQQIFVVPYYGEQQMIDTDLTAPRVLSGRY
jgi:uncharacterized DUF497 family protein